MEACSRDTGTTAPSAAPRRRATPRLRRRRHRAAGAAGDDPADEAGREDAEDGDQAVGTRHVALGAAAEAGVDDRLGGLVGGRDDPAGPAAWRAARSAGKPSVAMKPGRTRPTWTPWLALLGVEGVAPADQRVLAGRVGAGAGPRDPAGGAGDVDDRARRRAAQQRQQRLGEADDGVEVELASSARTFSQPSSAKRAAPGGAGVVDEQVEPTVRAPRRGRRLAPGRRRR